MTHRSEVYGEAMSMLDGLPEGSVVLDVDGDAWQKQDVRWTSVARGANTELMGSNSFAILTPLTVVYRPDVALAVFEKAHTPTDDEREAQRIAHLDARQAAYRKECEDWYVDHEAEPEIASNAFFRGWDAAVDGGFRRSERSQEDRREAARALLDIGAEVPEPSAAGPAFIALMPPSPETSKRWYSMYCRVCGIEEMMADTADEPRLLARRDEHNRERHAEPQGEPSDAQVDAVAVAIAVAANADYWTDEIAEWEDAEAWEREAYPDNYPSTAYEDREEFRKQARAALRAASEAGGEGR